MNEINYANYDFEDLVAQLQLYMQTRDGAWKDLQASSTGQVIIELFAYIANQVLFYTERRAEELFIDTAKNRQSVLNLVRLLNYNPRRVTSSIGTLVFSIDEAKNTVITIPMFTRCGGPGGSKFLTLQTVHIQPGQTEVEVYGIEGDLLENLSISTGLPEQLIRLPHTNVENSAHLNYKSLNVLVNGSPWTEVSSFLRSNRNSSHFRVITNFDDTVSIVFGDSSKGAIPPVGSEILVRYVLSNGASGNIFATDVITTMISTITYSTGAVADLKVTNTTSFLGGADRESVDDIKYNAPRIFATGQRAVTREDFITILENQTGVVVANAWGEKEVMEKEEEEEGILSMRNIVRFSLVMRTGEIGWDSPSSNDLNVIFEKLQQQAMMTVKYEYLAPDIVDVVPSLFLTVAPGANVSEIQQKITQAVENAFAPGTEIKLGSSIRYSDIICSINQIEGVSFLNLILKLYQNIYAIEGSYDYNGTLYVLPIKKETVQIYVNGELAATDDGTGAFDIDTDSGITDGSIDYDTGEIGINVDNESEIENMYVLYQQRGVGNIDLDFNQICRFDPSISWIEYNEINVQSGV